MADRKAIEVFDGDGPNRQTFIESVASIFNETFGSELEGTNPHWLEQEITEFLDNTLAQAEGFGSAAEKQVVKRETERMAIKDTIRAVTMQCPPCKGTGFAGDGHGCLDCGGTGKIRGTQNVD